MSSCSSESKGTNSFGKVNVNPNCILTDADNNDTYIGHYGGRLIFYFSRYSCMTCVYNQIKAIKHTEKHFNKDDIIILTDYETRKEIKIFATSYNCKYKVFRTNDEFIKEKRNIKTPFFIRFNKKLKTEIIFTCDDPNWEMTKSFLANYYSHVLEQSHHPPHPNLQRIC